MDNGIKKKMAKRLTEWLFNDFELVIDPPTEEEICQSLEEHQENV